MVELGKFNELEVLRQVDFGFYLDNGEEGILLPGKYAPEGLKPGDLINVFVYRDSEDRIIATTLKPAATVGGFAYLKVVDTSGSGAFLDWGIEKDLLVPFNEQRKKMELGRKYVVAIYVDELTNRIVGSAKIDKHLQQKNIYLEDGDPADIIIYEVTDLGFKAIVNNRYQGLLYKNEVFEKLFIGDKLKAWVKKVREDSKIDLSLEKSGLEKIDTDSEKLLKILKSHNGYLPLTDNSSPEEIKETAGMSKKAFKKAIGKLYKGKIIKLEEKGISIISESLAKKQ
ncbi:MAG: GntR family transcriptional regulator [Bacteroidetes bacterium]|nr:GntR family transcriptional regulator [Bacteroidota bacterium]HET6244570.1 S1-like domain-containing RNA-binding protein [Bacteroidia bacterium]